jgi:hypothetical protein
VIEPNKHAFPYLELVEHHHLAKASRSIGGNPLQFIIPQRRRCVCASVRGYVCVCVCVCVRGMIEEGGKEREREKCRGRISEIAWEGGRGCGDAGIPARKQRMKIADTGSTAIGALSYGYFAI